MVKAYTKESLKEDVQWLEGYGIERNEAENFIINLLGKKNSLNKKGGRI